MKNANTVLSLNRKASYLYSVKDKYEAGIVLTGEEVKSIRRGKADINSAFVIEKQGELYLVSATISKYSKSTHTNHKETRHRKLLLHKKQINKIIGSIKMPKYSAIVLKLYTNAQNKIKLEVAVAQGKSQIDKRETIKERQWNREKAQLLKTNEQIK